MRLKYIFSQFFAVIGFNRENRSQVKSLIFKKDHAVSTVKISTTKNLSICVDLLQPEINFLQLSAIMKTLC